MKVARPAALLAGLIAANITAAAAQDAPPDRQSILERARPDYDPLGIRAGSFLIFPSVELSESYESNIFATPSDTRSDFISTLAPSMRIASDWNVHAVSLQATGNFRKYASNDKESNDNFSVFGNGRLDILRDIFLTAGASYQLSHEARGSPDDRGGIEPTEFHVTSANLSFVQQALRLGYRVDTTVDSYDYNNVPTAAGTVINNNDRDRVVYALSPRVTYEIVPGYQAFVRTVINWRRYNAEVSSTGQRRNSQGYQIDAGTALDLGRVITGEVYVGYLNQDYDDPALPSASGVSFGGNLLWNVTQLTSVRFALARSVEETVLVGASSYIQTALRAGIEHELRRNVLLTGGGSYINSNYEGGGGRTDDLYEVSAGGRYLINRNLTAGADVTYRTRSSSAVGADYDDIIVSARLRLQL